jgi:hypothetical protein
VLYVVSGPHRVIEIGLVESDSNATVVPFTSSLPKQLEKPRAEGMEIDDRNMYPSRPSISAHSIGAAVVRREACEVEGAGLSYACSFKCMEGRRTHLRVIARRRGHEVFDIVFPVSKEKWPAVKAYGNISL